MTQTTQSLQNPSQQNKMRDDIEISLVDVISFLQASWKKLVIAATVGAVLGFGNWYALGSYSAELVLTNNGSIDLMSLRSLQKSLPNLANQIIDEGKVPQGQESLYRTLSNANWWQKNLLPTYGISKADTKDLVSTAGLEAAGSGIANLTIMIGGSSRDQAIENARNAKNFLTQGASYLAVKSLISSQESQILSADADIAKKINTIQIELGYQQERLKKLEVLAKRFPNDTKVISQLVDPKDSSAKYLPISTQIIAANADINASRELLERLKNAQVQMTVLRTWVNEASPLMNGSYDGLNLIDQLIKKESQLRATLDPKDFNSISFVDDLRVTLLGLNVRFTRGFEINIAPTARKNGILKSTAGGLAVAFFLMLLVLTWQRVWQAVKSGAMR